MNALLTHIRKVTKDYFRPAKKLWFWVFVFIFTAIMMYLRIIGVIE